jgi:glycosyltransferase involved in cell wall biosynthesis
MEISVVTCTHNPNPIFLKRVLAALQAQTLPKERWELLLADNASATVLAPQWNLSWHLNARHLREEKIGKTNALLQAIDEAQSPLLMIVDDDNILDPAYLQTALDLGAKNPHLGAWGGSCLPEFETKPPGFLEQYLNRLAITTVARPRWSNSYEDFEAIPPGAGMVVRRDIARQYAKAIKECKIRKQLGRTGKSLACCEDTDLAWTAIDMGFSVGRFPELKLTHLIPKRRLEPDYILELIKGDAASRVLLDHVYHRKTFNASKPGFLRDLWLRFRMPPFDYQAWKATNEGVKKGLQLVNQA